MRRTIWFASYPKSGNTWFQMIVANLVGKDDKPIDINHAPVFATPASDREAFDYVTLLDSGLLTLDEIDCLRPRVNAELARGIDDDEFEDNAKALPVRFVLVHDAYRLTPNGEPLLAGRRGADGAILLVRDPRDVAPSYASYHRMSIDQAIARMNDARHGISGDLQRQRRLLRQGLLGWSGHAKSWLSQTDIPVCVIRYEDMKADTVGTLRHALDFAGWPATDADVRRAVAFTDFADLRKQEQEKGFWGLPAPHLGGQFFRRGEAGGWRDELTAEQVARIEAAHGPMMRRFGYDLSSEAVPASNCLPM